ncbi:sigma-70 family RNA polymerase sigma factor [Aeoliella sp.]|uniref:sigma-70 family RNA polymerase sigma factor n=1 Tax=Aeoliella sp. TaxID=2795800 RepID=UPI003CCC3E55
MKSSSEKQTNRAKLDSDYMRLWAANQRRVHGFILTLLPYGLDADETLQEVSITAWEKYADVANDIAGSSEAFVKWACAIARFKALDCIRKRSSSGRIVFSDELVEELAILQESQAEYLESRNDALIGCIAKLSERDRNLLRGRYESEMSVKQIATAVGLSVRSVYASLQRIRLSLLRCVEVTLDSGSV